MVRNHPFTDGNKRTALIVTNLLLLRSGYDLKPAAATEAEDFFVKVAAGECSFVEIEDWLRARILKQP